MELRKRFQDDVILVRLGIQRADLPLPKGIVERGIDLVGCDVQTRCRGPVNGELCAHTIGLLVGRYIGDLR